MNYSEFLAHKSIMDIPAGFEPRQELINDKMFDFQADIVRWACRRGRAALFEDCGLGKTPQQLNWAEEVCQETGGNVLILAPLSVAEQTKREGKKFGIKVNHAHQTDDCQTGINVTNYEKLHRFDVSKFAGVVLDESSILKSYDGATRTAIIEAFERTPYKLACTATPAPNDYMELGNHAEFLGVMKRTEMLSMFFVHDGGDTSKWRLKGHAESDFWRWVSSWAVNIRRPSDLGYEDGQFRLPKLHIKEHIVHSNQKMDGYLFALPASSLDERRDARRSSLSERVQKCSQMASGSEQWLIWCNLNSESAALKSSIEGAVEVSGATPEDQREAIALGFINGDIRVVISKPSIWGFGLNLQHCFNMAFVGLSDSYEQFYQAIRRCWRFGQKKEVNAHIIISDLEGAVAANIERKERDARRMAEEMVRHMADISSEEIRGMRRDSTGYQPTIKMELPAWIQSAA